MISGPGLNSSGNPTAAELCVRTFRTKPRALGRLEHRLRREEHHLCVHDEHEVEPE